VTDIRAFRALRFDPAKVRIDDVLAPPYDVISPGEAQRLREKSAHNIIHLDLPDAASGAPYTHAAKLLETWRAEGVLRRDPQPAFYLITDSFELDGKVFHRTGITAAVRLQPFGQGSIFAHESTLSGPKMDRFRLMATTSSNFSSIMAMYPDPDSAIRNLLQPTLDRPSILEGTGPTGPFALRLITDPGLMARLRGLFADRPIFIADGHHRYETALAYHNTAAGVGNYYAAYVMMHLMALEDPTLQVLPTHRLIRPSAARPLVELLEALRKDFTVTELPAKAIPGFPAMDEPFGAFLLHAPGRTFRLALKPEISPADIDPQASEDWCRLDVAVLQKRIFEPLLGITAEKLRSQELLAYSHDLAESVDGVNAGRFAYAFLLRATPVQAVASVARHLETMPPKSTFFYPKLITGLTIRSLAQG